MNTQIVNSCDEATNIQNKVSPKHNSLSNLPNCQLKNRISLFGFIVLLMMTTVGSLCYAQNQPSDRWNQFRGYSPHLGFQDYEIGITLTNVGSLKVTWSDPNYFAGNSSPVVVPTTLLPGATWALYVGSDYQGVTAYDADGLLENPTYGPATCPTVLGIRNCGPVWANEAKNSAFDSSPAFAGLNTGKFLLFYIGNSTMSTYDLSDGSFLWSAKQGTGFTNYDPIFSSPAFYGDVAYVGALDGHVYAFDGNGNQPGCPSNCTPIWTSASLTGSHSVISSPAVVQTKVGALIVVGDRASGIGSQGGVTFYYADDNPAMGIKGGDIYWEIHNGIGDVSSSPLVFNGIVYVGSASLVGIVKNSWFYSGNLYALDPATKSVKWSYPLADGMWSSTALEYKKSSSLCSVSNCPPDQYDILYAAAGNQLYGFDLQKPSTPLPQLVCQQSLTTTISYSSPAVITNVLFIGGSDGNLHAFDTHQCKGNSGSPLPMPEVLNVHLSGSPINSSPTVANGMVYVSTQDGLFALK